MLVSVTIRCLLSLSWGSYGVIVEIIQTECCHYNLQPPHGVPIGEVNIIARGS